MTLRDRIAWSPDGRRLLALHGGALAIRTRTGEVVTALPARAVRVVDTGYAPANYLIARWLPDGRIAAVDAVGRAVLFSMRGEPYAELVETDAWSLPMTSDDVDLAADGRAYFSRGFGQQSVEVRSTGSENTMVWNLDRWRLGIHVPITRGVLSYDARCVALRTETTPVEWIVLAIGDANGGNDTTRTARLLKRIISPYVAFARDRVLPHALAYPDAVLDDIGLRVARADATTLHVTYLDANETLALPHGLTSPVTALAFGDGEIACLTEAGAIELLPIP